MASLRALLLGLFVADGAAPSPVASPWRNHRALIALAPLLGVVFGIIVIAPWHSSWEVDTMTHFVQVHSVADHGTIGAYNGPVDRSHPELTPRWLVPARGQAWGTYPATMSYVLAVGMKLDGFRGSIREIWLLFAVALVVTYALTYRLTQRPAVAVAAAYALGAASSLGMWATMMYTFVPVAAFGISATYLAMRAADVPDLRASLRRAAGAGLCSSVAVGGHLLWLPAFVVLGLALVAVGSDARVRLGRGVVYGLASVPSLALMSWTNFLRWNTWNPISYGPCDGDGCLGQTTLLTNPQNGAAFFREYAGVLPFIAVALGAAWLLRRRRREFAVLVGVVACVALVPDSETRVKTARLIKVAWGYLVDEGSLDVGYPRFSDNLGSYNNLLTYGGPWVVRSLLQCSPFAAAALLVRPEARPGARVAVIALAGTVLGVVAMLVMRAHMHDGGAFGLSSVNHRYLLPALPAVTVLAFVALAALPWRPWHGAGAAATAVYGGLALASGRSDEDLLRRQITLWFPLGLAFALWLAAALARGARPSAAWAGATAAVLAAIAVGYGAAVVYGVDRVFVRDVRGFQDARTAELARCTPRRFVLLGGHALDETLPLRDQRDIYFINPGMNLPGNGARLLLDDALRRDPARPAFLIQDEPYFPWHFYWPGYRFEPVPGCPRIERIVRAPPPASTRR
jgi:hypothetical protein